MYKKLLTWLLLLCLLACVPGCGKQVEQKAGDTDTGKTGEAGSEITEFEISFTATELFTGEKVNFPRDYLGDVIYLIFFSFG